MKMTAGKPLQCARRSLTGRYRGELPDYCYLGISSRPPQCQHANACRFPQTVSRQQDNGMQEKEPYVAASQPKKPSVCHGKIVVGHQKPCADASEGHFQANKGRLSIAEHESHERISFLSPALQEQQRAQGIERRGPEHKEEQNHCTSRGTVGIGIGCLASTAELSASPMNSQGTPERCGMYAAVELPTSLGDDDSHWMVHAVLPFSALLTNSTAHTPLWLLPLIS